MRNLLLLLTTFVFLSSAYAENTSILPPADSIFAIAVRPFENSSDADRKRLLQAWGKLSPVPLEEAHRHRVSQRMPNGVVVFKDKSVYYWEIWGNKKEYIEFRFKGQKKPLYFRFPK